jgi:hypothetical protein
MVDTKRAQALERRLRVEKMLAYVAAGMAVLTLLWHDWIELVFRVDPDGGSGAVEWAVVAALAALSVVFAAIARADKRRLVTVLEGSGAAPGSPSAS